MPKITPAFGPRRRARHPFVRVDLGDYSAAPDLGAQVGLTQFGVHMEILHPGATSSLRHWHESEGEFVYLVAGELVLVEDEETVLRAGEAAGRPVGHCLQNRSDPDATILVVGTRAPRDRWRYVDHGVTGSFDGASRSYVRDDGTPVERETP